MNTIYPITILGDQVLIVNKDDTPFIGKERALEVMCVQIDFRHTKIYPPIEWKNTSSSTRGTRWMTQQEMKTLKKLHTTFLPEDITENIEKTLTKTLIQ